MKLAGLNLIYQRSPDFTALLRAQSSDYLSIVGRHNQEFLGFASASMSRRYVEDKLLRVGYLGDMRIQSSRLTSRLWRKAYPKLLQHLAADYFFTAIVAQNRTAKKNLVNQKRSSGFRYDFLKTVRMINLLARKPWSSGSRLLVRPAVQTDESNIRKLLTRFNKNVFLGYDFSEAEGNEWTHRQLHWPGWRLEDFLVLEKDKRILAVTLPWAPTAIKRMMIDRCPWPFRILNQISKFFGGKAVRAGENLSTLYLTHLAWDDSLTSREGAEAFAHWLFKNRHNHHIISYAEQKHRQKSSGAFVSFEFEIDLFSVRLESQPPRQPVDGLVGFEMGIV